MRKCPQWLPRFSAPLSAKPRRCLFFFNIYLASPVLPPLLMLWFFLVQCQTLPMFPVQHCLSTCLVFHFEVEPCQAVLLLCCDDCRLLELKWVMWHVVYIRAFIHCKADRQFLLQNICNVLWNVWCPPSHSKIWQLKLFCLSFHVFFSGNNIVQASSLQSVTVSPSVYCFIFFTSSCVILLDAFVALSLVLVWKKFFQAVRFFLSLTNFSVLSSPHFRKSSLNLGCFVLWWRCKFDLLNCEMTISQSRQMHFLHCWTRRKTQVLSPL